MNRFSFSNIWLAFYFSLVVSIVSFTLISSVFNYVTIVSTRVFFLILISVWILFLFRLRKKIILPKKIDISWVIVFCLVGILFIQGFFAAPNNTDSMVYRLPRVMYWIEEQSVLQREIYTNHDFMTPYADYILLQLYILFNSDRFLFLSQLFAYITAVILSGKLLYLFLNNSSLTKYGILLTATLPMAVMQANSVQVDLVVTVFFLYTIYFCLQMFKNGFSIKHVSLLLISIVFGLMMKITFIFWGIIPGFVILYLLFKRIITKQNIIQLVLIFMLVFLSFTGYFFLQNMRLFGSFTGEQKNETEVINYLIESFLPGDLISGVIKNILLHIPFPLFNQQLYEVLNYIHALFGVDLQQTKNMWINEKFYLLPIIYPHEDLAGNFITVLLFSLGLIMLLRNWKKYPVIIRLFSVLVVLSFVLFSVTLKWQPWHSRLHLPIFFLMSILVVVILGKYKRLLFFSSYLSLFLAFILIIFNYSRPIISYPAFIKMPVSKPVSIFLNDREIQYYKSYPFWYSPYHTIFTEIKEDDTVEVSRLVDGFLYPLLRNLNQRSIKYATTGNVTFSTSQQNNHGSQTICSQSIDKNLFACLERKK